MTAAVNVINCTLYRDNPYQQMLFAPLTDRYTATRGTVEDAIAARQGDARALLHIHWEEHLLRAMPTLQEARIAAGHFTRQLARYRSGGGKTIWTIHNAAPHELEHLEVFQSVRSVLADAADRILVHTVDAVGVLAEQVALDRSKVFYLPHPSYLGIYEPVAQLEESLRRTPGRSVITFGKLRRYKGLERLLDELPPEFLRELGSSLEIRGEPLAGDDYVPELQARSAGRDDVLWDTRRIGDEEVPGLLRAARCLVMPYSRFLTSGVALLCVSLGVPLVGPRTRGLEEVLPTVAHRFLFDPESPRDMARAVRDVFELDDDAYRGLCEASVERARHFAPARIARLLGSVYDSLTA